MSRTASLGAHRLPLPSDASPEERLERSREMLFHALEQGTTVAVLGTGCSMPLGYPSWQGFAKELVEHSLEALSAAGRPASDTAGRERLLRFRATLASSAQLGSRELMFMIGFCKRLFAHHAAEGNPYHGYVVGRFGLREEPVEVDHNPHRALLGLPIDRFVTTNYDCEIERALRDERGVAWEAFGIAPGEGPPERNGSRLSFTQRPENCDRLALFALARVSDHLPEARNMVFHCHGRFDDPDSIVATELDYQRWYLAEHAEATPGFLQTFDLLFTSNPILFLGFGLADEDLLRPLRRIGATSPERREFRPLFALVPEASPGADQDHHEQLFERYGLNVLPFVAPATSDPSAWGRVLCDELARLEEDRLVWCDAWHEKPQFRAVSVRARLPQPYLHYSIDPRGHEILGRERVTEKLEELRQKVRGGARVIGLVGPGGTGKSFHAMRLLEEVARTSGDFRGFFFWSSYYADDALTGVDRLLAYIDPEGDRTLSRLRRLRERLKEGRYFVVFDGVERLLRTTDDPEAGKSNDPVTQKLLQIFADPKSQSVLLLTSRLWPRDLDPRLPGIERIWLERLRTDDVTGVGSFARLDRSALSVLCSLLDGHTYALFLAARFLGQGSRGEADDRLLVLRRRLSRAHPDRRLGTMIDLTLDDLDRVTGSLARPSLERLAVFMSPVSHQTVRLCFELALEAGTPRDASETRPSADRVIELLRAAGVLFRVVPGPTEHDPPAFTVHPTVRTFLFHQAAEVEREMLPNFTLAGFTSARAAVHPGSPDTAELVRRLFERLEKRAMEELNTGRAGAAAELCRSLFGILRSRMEANTVSRWTTYPDYIQYGLRLTDFARRISSGRWSFRERHELREIEDLDAPLYADEVAFLYNDIGLTLCAEGYMQDTLDLWQEGYEINRIIEGTAEVAIYSLQSQLHLGHTFLELGQLPIAEQYLEEAARTNQSIGDHDYAGRIYGYRALICFYRGHFDEADRWYTRAFAELKKAGGNPRAQSFFLNHRAKLAIFRRDLPQAQEYVQSSWALAASIRAEDLLAYGRTVRGRLAREAGSLREATAQYHAALADARRLGIRRLEAEVLCGLCRVSLDLGDHALARHRAIAALALANELGLGLRQSLCLSLLGLATRRSGQPRLGAAYLRLAEKLGDAQQHWLHNRNVEQSLRALHQEAEDG